ncbi:MAG: response regulator transcription factor [Bacteroidales bacterium]|nr:response regulator transcription factor [Bacteroidales bacterium]
MKTDTIQVIVVDDHRLFRLGLKASFQNGHPDITIAGEADCGKALFALLASTSANLVLLDINLPDMGGADIARQLRRDYPNMKVLAISGENSAEAVTSMLEAGIDGFISKQNGDFDELAEAIRAVMSGLEYFGRDIAWVMYDVYKTKTRTTAVSIELSKREREVIELCRDGLLCKEIAARLGISPNTVNTHKERIFQKIGINNTLEMVQYALKNGIIRVEN